MALIVMIPDPEIFIGIAALGLTVTGFSGLISVVGRRSEGHWTDSERFQLAQLIEISLAVTFISFTPILVAMALTPESALPTATALVAVFHLLILCRGSYKTVTRGKSFAFTGLPTAVATILIGGGLALILAALVASFGYIGGLAFLLVSNLLWQLLVASIHFAALLLNTGDGHEVERRAR